MARNGMLEAERNDLRRHPLQPQRAIGKGLPVDADQMADARVDDRAALGFIGLGPTYWKELQLPVEIIRTIVSDEQEERLNALSSTFLGLNLACARCHDHKNDPITTEDYYGIAGVFASTRQADQALASGVDGLVVAEARQQVAGLEAELVGHRIGPRGDEILDVALVDALERRMTLGVVAHPVSQNIARGLVIVEKVGRRLSRRRNREAREK